MSSIQSETSGASPAPLRPASRVDRPLFERQLPCWHNPRQSESDHTEIAAAIVECKEPLAATDEHQPFICSTSLPTGRNLVR